MYVDEPEEPQGYKPRRIENGPSKGFLTRRYERPDEPTEGVAKALDFLYSDELLGALTAVIGRNDGILMVLATRTPDPEVWEQPIEVAKLAIIATVTRYFSEVEGDKLATLIKNAKGVNYD